MKEMGPADFGEWEHLPEGVGQGQGDGKNMNEPDWGDSEIREPLPPAETVELPFDLTQFDADIPTAVESPLVAEAKNQVVGDAFSKHASFVDYDGAATSLQLEHWKQSGEVAHIAVHLGEGGAVHIRFDDGSAIDPIEHYYHQRLNPETGAPIVHREDLDADAYVGDLPSDGELPREQRIRLIAERYQAGAPDRELAEQFGLGPKEVGLAEMEYVQKLVDQAEPQRISIRRLFGIMEDRLGSPWQPSAEEARLGAYAFVSYVQGFLRQRADSGQLGVTEDLIDPQNIQETMRVHAAERSDEQGRMTPFVEVTHTELLPLDAPSAWLVDASSATVRRTFTYHIEDYQFMSDYQLRVTNEAGEEITVTKQSTTADETEASAVRNFLYNPLFRKELP